MKRIAFVIAGALMLAAYSQAQFRKGNWELAFSGSVGSFKSSTTSSGQTHSESNTFALLAVNPGYYLIDGLSLEAEVGLLTIEKENPAYSILGNLSYTLPVSNGSVAPYGRIGYGLSNGFQTPMTGSAILRSSDKFDVGVFNAGAGVKFLVSQGAAIRAEVNYRSYSWDKEYRFFGSTYKTEYSYSNVGLLLGISVLL